MKYWKDGLLKTHYLGLHKNPLLYFPGASLIAQLVKNCLQCRRPWFTSRVRKIPWRRDRLPTPVFLGFPGGSDGEDSACSDGDLSLIPGLGRSPGGTRIPTPVFLPGELHGQKSLVGYIVHGVAKSQTRLSD